MARVVGIGELDWRMYKYSNPVYPQGLSFELPIREYSDIESQKCDSLVYELNFTLIPDNQAGSYYCTEYYRASDSKVLISCKLYEDQVPIVLGERMIRIFNKCRECFGSCSAKAWYENNVVVVLICIYSRELPRFPDKFLHSLARKMSKWAKE